jgi:protein-disulfide isomerase
MPVPTKRELREQRRAARLEAERTEAAARARRRRITRLGIVAGLAAACVAAAVAISSPDEDPPRATPPGLFAGIPERNGVLGDPDAPLTVTEFVDLQCPVCATAAEQTLPTLIRDYVRPGKVKLEARLLHFLGPDSVTAARAAAAAQQQGRLWPFLEAFYAAQGPENSGYVTDDFLDDVAAAAGVDLGAADDDYATRQLERANADAGRLGVDGTPTFVVDGRPLEADPLDPASVSQALDRVLER